MGYEVNFTPQALEDISKLDSSVAERVLKKINWLAENCEVINPQPLKGKFQGMFKLVVGDWRVIYELNFTRKQITVHFLGHRREVYKL